MMTLKKALSLSIPDQLFLDAVNRDTFDEKNFFEHEFRSQSLEMIIKASCHSNKFESICLNETWNGLWGALIPDYMASLDLSLPQDLTFSSLEHVSNFQWLRGLYFYSLSLQARQPSGEIGYSEMELLKKALEFHSIHAMQQYHRYCLHEIRNDPESAEQVFREIIQDCKSQLSEYRSYAYMMLAEAFYQYASWLIERGSDRDIAVASKAWNAAIESCQYASKYLEISDDSIASASLGRGLGVSNTYGIDSPSRAEEIINQALSSQIRNHEMAVNEPVQAFSP